MRAGDPRCRVSGARGGCRSGIGDWNRVADGRRRDWAARDPAIRTPAAAQLGASQARKIKALLACCAQGAGHHGHGPRTSTVCSIRWRRNRKSAKLTAMFGLGWVSIVELSCGRQSAGSGLARRRDRQDQIAMRPSSQRHPVYHLHDACRAAAVTAECTPAPYSLGNLDHTHEEESRIEPRSPFPASALSTRCTHSGRAECVAVPPIAMNHGLNVGADRVVLPPQVQLLPCAGTKGPRSEPRSRVVVMSLLARAARARARGHYAAGDEHRRQGAGVRGAPLPTRAAERQGGQIS